LVTYCLETAFYKHVTEEKIEGRRRRGRERKQLLDDLKQKRRYWNMKEEAQDRRTGFGSVYGFVARLTAK
jgi:hypothetical protein